MREEEIDGPEVGEQEDGRGEDIIPIAGEAI